MFPLIPPSIRRQAPKSCIMSSGQRKPIVKRVTNKTVKKPSQRKNKPRQPRQDSDASTASESPESDTGRSAIMPKGRQLKNLPSVLLSQRTTYFATLFSALFASQEPFNHFTKTSPAFLTISRTAFKSIWPRLKITLEVDDALFNVVRLPRKLSI
jgi:hypothetical protein